MRSRAASMTPTHLHAWTGLSPRQLAVLTQAAWKLAPDAQTGGPWALPFIDRVTLVALAHRTNLTERQLAALFGVPQPQIDRVMRRLSPVFAALFGPPPLDRRRLVVVDGTLVPVHDHTRTAKSKNYRRSVNIQVAARASDRQVVAVGEAWPGNRNDIIVFRNTLQNDPDVGEYPRLKGDGGYRGVDTIQSPRRGPGGLIIHDASYRRFVKRRAAAEHVLARLKDWQILRQCRRRGSSIDQAARAVAMLHNLRIQHPDN